MPPIQPINVVPDNASQSISSTGNMLGQLAQASMQQRGESARQQQQIKAQQGFQESSQSHDQEMNSMDQEFQREMTGRQEGLVREGQTFQAEQQALNRQHEVNMQDEAFQWQGQKTKELQDFQLKLQELEVERDEIRRQGKLDMMPAIQERLISQQREYQKRSHQVADALMAHSLLSAQGPSQLANISKTLTDSADAETAEVQGTKRAATDAFITTRQSISARPELFESNDPNVVVNHFVDGIITNPGLASMISRSDPNAGEALKGYLAGVGAGLPSKDLAELKQKAIKSFGSAYKLEGALAAIEEGANTAFNTEGGLPKDKTTKQSSALVASALSQLSGTIRQARAGLPSYEESIKERGTAVYRVLSKLSTAAPESFEQIVSGLPPREKVMIITQLTEYMDTMRQIKEQERIARSATDGAAETGMEGEALKGLIEQGLLGVEGKANARTREGLRGLQSGGR